MDRALGHHVTPPQRLLGKDLSIGFGTPRGPGRSAPYPLCLHAGKSLYRVDAAWASPQRASRLRVHGSGDWPDPGHRSRHLCLFLRQAVSRVRVLERHRGPDRKPGSPGQCVRDQLLEYPPPALPESGYQRPPGPISRLESGQRPPGRTGEGPAKVRRAISEAGWNSWSLATAVLEQTGKQVFIDTARDHQRPKYLISIRCWMCA